MPLVLLLLTGCGVKVSQLPNLQYPYVSEMEFLKEVKNVGGRAKKKRFKHDRIQSPFYFFLKIKEIENSGTVSVSFYPWWSPVSGKTKQAKKTAKDQPGQRLVEKKFQFGQAGKYYEYIIFFDQVEILKPGKYRYAIFINQQLIYEDQLLIQ